MAFSKYARADIVKADIGLAGWEKVNPQLRTASKVVLQEYDPKAFMLTHCTIIASVDTEHSDAPLGRSIVNGFEVDRKYSDWQITPETVKYSNNNHDAWERKLLLACFRTFVGGENYVEHIQIPELSKGKIIDTAARDIGDSIYVDILVATERKHRPLITAITQGTLQTLSMGCQVEFTICSKCGNVAYDETQLCPCIRYFKGKEFVDEFGKKRRIVELCGHINEEPGSVKFIEASWVANPAFTGAVLRNILSPEDIANIGQKMAAGFSGPTRKASPGSYQKTARLLGPDGSFARISQLLGLTAEEQEQDGGMGMGDAGTPKPAKPEPSAIDKAVDDMADQIREKALAKIRQEMGKGESQPDPETNQNNNIIREACQHPSWKGIAKRVLGLTKGNPRVARKVFLGLVLYKSGGWGAVRASRALTGRDILGVARVLDLIEKPRVVNAGENRLYCTVLRVGSLANYSNENAYLAACRRVVGRDLTLVEQRAIMVKARLFSLGS